MAVLTEDQKAARALKRKRTQALAAEAEHARQQGKLQEWADRGLRLTYEELVSGVPCRGCGLPIIDGLEPFPGTMYLTPEQQAEYDVREEAYRQMHGHCRAHRWALSGNRQLHCGFCCPPPPMSPKQIEDLSRLMAGWPKPDPRELDTWRLLLTCEHVVDHQMHHTNQYWTRSVVECSECGQPRGVVTSNRVRSGAVEAREKEAELMKQLRAAKRELAQLRHEVKTLEAKIADLED